MAAVQGLSVEEVARRCRSSPEAVRLWIDLKLLRVLEADDGPRVSVPALLEFLDHYNPLTPLQNDSLLKKILALDDEPHILAIVREVFTRDPRLHIETAESGFEALIRFGQLKPDLVILDLHLAGMNGIDVCRRIKGHPDFLNTKVVVLTGFPQSALLPELTAISVDRVLIKPVSIDELADAVYGLLAIPRMAVTPNPRSPTS